MPDIPIISIVGRSGSGKTTLMEKLIPELARRGLRVATVKHDAHGFEADREGKDTWRHRMAGAVCSVISSSKGLAMFRAMDREASLDEIRGMVGDVDLVLTEGYKRESAPKVEVYRKGVGDAPLCAGVPELIALVSDIAVDTGAPRLTFDEMARLADIIEERCRHSGHGAERKG
jgi:molybdopterin-guanine dinucleotide biosynthesis protein B